MAKALKLGDEGLCGWSGVSRGRPLLLLHMPLRWTFMASPGSLQPIHARESSALLLCLNVATNSLTFPLLLVNLHMQSIALASHFSLSACRFRLCGDRTPAKWLHWKRYRNFFDHIMCIDLKLFVCLSRILKVRPSPFDVTSVSAPQMKRIHH